MKAIIRLEEKSFVGHAGRPGQVGGSAPKSGAPASALIGKMNKRDARWVKSRMSSILQRMDDYEDINKASHRKDIALNLREEGKAFSKTHPNMAARFNDIADLFGKMDNKGQSVNSSIKKLLSDTIEQVSQYT